MAATTSRAKPRRRAASGPRRRGKVYGHEAPRIFTPPRRPLTEQTSAGFAAIRFADWLHEQLKDTRHAELAPALLPWQRWFLIHALELNPDNSYRFDVVLLWVARQNGKTFLAALLILFRMYIDGQGTAIGVAQKLATAKKTWDHAHQIIDAVPRLKREYGKTSNVNGEQWFELVTGQRFWVDSADNGGRGLTFDFVFIDEILKHKTFKAWSALSKTTNARPRPQILAAGNAGDLDAIVQRHLHAEAMSAITRDDASTSTGLFWWCPPEDAPTGEPETWAYSNPGLNYTIKESSLRGDWSRDPAPVFLAEVLNLFPSAATGGPFQTGRWAAQRDRLSKRAPDAPVYLCIEVAANGRGMSHIAFASRRSDGDVHVGIMASRAGTDWLVPWLTSPDRTFTPAAITFQTRGAPVSSLLSDFNDAGLDVTEWGGADLGRATGLLLDGVNQGTIWHRDQPVLDVPAGTAVTKAIAGGAHLIDRVASPGDASPLSGIAGAYWLLRNPPAVAEPNIRVLRRRRNG